MGTAEGTGQPRADMGRAGFHRQLHAHARGKAELGERAPVGRGPEKLGAVAKGAVQGMSPSPKMQSAHDGVWLKRTAWWPIAGRSSERGFNVEGICSIGPAKNRPCDSGRRRRGINRRGKGSGRGSGSSNFEPIVTN